MTGALAGRRWTVLSALVIVALVASVVGFAIASRGLPADSVQLHDGGIWVTTNGGGVSSGLVGRFNYPIAQLDAAFSPPGGAQTTYQLDVLQHDDTVLAWDQAVGRLYPVDEATALPRQSSAVTVPASFRIALGGSTIAVMDPAKGRLWLRTTATLDGLDPTGTAPDVSDLGSGAALAVGLDGTAFALSIAHDRVVVVPPRGAGGQSAVPLAAAVHPGAQVSAVGGTPVVFDPSANAVLAGTAPAVSLPPSRGEALLQQPGDVADSALVATSSSLVSVPLAGGSPAVVVSVPPGAPAAPVRLGGCIHGAWGGAPATYYRGCGGQGGTQPVRLSGNRAVAHPVFRVNHSTLVLNDLDTGGLWVLDQGPPQEDDNWKNVSPETSSQGTDNAHDSRGRTALQDTHPPIAPDQHVSARPGRTTVLHLLDSVSDPSGAILMLAGVGIPTGAGAAVSVAGGGEVAQLTLAASAKDTQFTYRVSDGANPPVQATVFVHVAAPSEETAPSLFDHQKDALVVAIGQSRSVSLLDGWRDAEGDPLFISTASVMPAGSVTTATDGRLIFTAPTTPGSVTITYEVSDGALRGSAAIGVTVLGPKDPPQAPIPNDDTAETLVGQPVTILPLANDVAGADGANPGAGMSLQAVGQPAGANVAVDAAAGAVTFTSTVPRTFTFDYGVSTGASPTAHGRIRVDVAADPTSTLPPVAMPDLAVVHGVGTVKVPVLANDSSPSGAVLMVVGAGSDVGGVTAGVLDHQQVLVTVSAVLPQPRTIHYQMTDGQSAPVTGDIVVEQIQDGGGTLPPVTTPVDAVVRAGDVTSIPVVASDIDPLGGQLTLVPGPLALVPKDEGGAFVAGNEIRYVPPASVPSEQIVTATYTVANARGKTALGTVTIRVEPVDPATNAAPTPPDLEARVVAGSRTTIPVPAFGADPDGDSVTLVGPATSPQLGRIVGTTHDEIVYEAFPTAHGTDEFSYAAIDRFGAVGLAHVRVGVLPFGASEAPFAVDDTATAAPGETLNVDVLANDLGVQGGDVSIAMAPGAPAGFSVSGTTVEVAVPPDGQTVRARYVLTTGSGQSSASIAVTGEAGHIVEPIARDDVVPPVAAGQTSATVDVLANDESPIEPHSALILETVAGTGTSISSGQLVVPVGTTPRVLPYVVSDGLGGSAVGFVWIPSRSDPTPRIVSPPPSIDVPAGGSLSVAVASVVAVLPGRPVRAAAGEPLTTSPQSGLSVTVDGTGATLRLSDVGGYAGPASVTFTAVDSDQPGDTTAHSAVLTLDVTVGVAKPLIQCAATPLLLTASITSTYHLSDLCEVWTEDPAQRGSLTYAAVWQADPGGVVMHLAGDTLTLDATTAVHAGVGGAIAVQVTDPRTGAGDSTILDVVISVPPPPRMYPIQRSGISAGTIATIDVRPAVDSPYGAAANVTILSASETGTALGAGVTFSGSSLTIAVPATARGTLTVGLTVTDAPAAAARSVSGVVTLGVIGVPDAPAAPSVQATAPHTVTVSWAPPSGNGAGVTAYQLQDARGATYPCSGTPLCNVPNLADGVADQFEVRAQNSVGWGPFSPFSPPIVPGSVPDAPPAPAAVTNASQTAVVTWTPPNSNGAVVTSYEVEDDQSHVTPCGSPCTVTGLTNGATYRFEVRARNAFGWGPFSPFSNAVSPGDVPGVMGQPSAIDHDSGSSAGYDGAIHVGYTIPADNGRPITGVEYSLSSGGASAGNGAWSYAAGPAQGTAATQSIGQLTNGHAYTVEVRACNSIGCGAWSPFSGGATPYGPPGAPSASASANGTTITFGWSGGGGGGRPVSDYQTSIDGGGWTSHGASPGTQQVAYGYSETHSVRARVVDSAGQISAASGSASATTAPPPPPPPPPPQPTVTITQGAHVTVSDCATVSCAHIHVTLQNLVPNTHYTFQYYESATSTQNGGNWCYDLTNNHLTDGNGYWSGDGSCYYGMPGRTVWVVVSPGGVTSNQYIWPST